MTLAERTINTVYITSSVKHTFMVPKDSFIHSNGILTRL